ncbi:MAG: rod shape-determining protein, partial [Candidatus Adiutrix sp.]|nr:rod shape-determining protein [Candidatus Adiutrix sp.]
TIGLKLEFYNPASSVKDRVGRAIIEAAEAGGGKSVHLVDEPMAAAVGLGLSVEEPVARLVLDVGGGTSEGVLISMGAIAFSESRRVAGDEATHAIIRYLRNKYGLSVGENTAEHIKMTIGSAMPLEELHTFNCRGKELSRGIPREVELTSDDIREALKEIVEEFIDMVKRLTTQAPPELSADLVRQGVYLTGGGSLLKGLDRRLAQEIGLRVNIPDDPLLSVVLGLGRILENMNYYRSVFVS